jgi:SET domain-containing protein
MYKPLPHYITIKKSPISGLGLFATEKIEAHALIGITHHANEHSEDGFIRTPLGGFGNHSDEPNCFKLLMSVDYKMGDVEPETWWIGASRDIEPGEELTWNYTLYSIESEMKT